MRIDAYKIQANDSLKQNDIIVIDAREVGYGYKFYFGKIESMTVNSIHFQLKGLYFGDTNLCVEGIRSGYFSYNPLMLDVKLNKVKIYKVINEDMYKLFTKTIHTNLTINGFLDILNVIDKKNG